MASRTKGKLGRQERAIARFEAQKDRINTIYMVTQKKKRQIKNASANADTSKIDSELAVLAGQLAKVDSVIINTKSRIAGRPWSP